MKKTCSNCRHCKHIDLIRGICKHDEDAQKTIFLAYKCMHYSEKDVDKEKDV